MKKTILILFLIASNVLAEVGCYNSSDDVSLDTFGDRFVDSIVCGIQKGDIGSLSMIMVAVIIVLLISIPVRMILKKGVFA